MPTIKPPPMTKPEAQVSLVHHMLAEHGRDRASELILVNGRMYRITAERLPPEEIPEVARRFVQDIEDSP